MLSVHGVPSVGIHSSVTKAVLHVFGFSPLCGDALSLSMDLPGSCLCSLAQALRDNTSRRLPGHLRTMCRQVLAQRLHSLHLSASFRVRFVYRVDCCTSKHPSNYTPSSLCHQLNSFQCACDFLDSPVDFEVSYVESDSVAAALPRCRITLFPRACPALAVPRYAESPMTRRTRPAIPDQWAFRQRWTGTSSSISLFSAVPFPRLSVYVGTTESASCNCLAHRRETLSVRSTQQGPPGSRSQVRVCLHVRSTRAILPSPVRS